MPVGVRLGLKMVREMWEERWEGRGEAILYMSRAMSDAVKARRIGRGGEAVGTDSALLLGRGSCRASGGVRASDAGDAGNRVVAYGCDTWEASKPDPPNTGRRIDILGVDGSWWRLACLLPVGEANPLPRTVLSTDGSHRCTIVDT